MDHLPLEILEEILNNLSFVDLLNACLVSQRWNLAAETRLLRRASLRIDSRMACQLEVLHQCRRNYDSVSLTGGTSDDWEDLQPIMEVCVIKFQPRSIRLSNILADHLNQFYESYQHWLENAVEIRISMDDRLLSHLSDEPASYTLNLPKMQRLYWHECLYGAGEKTITLNASNLKAITIDDSLDETTRLKIPNCEKVEKLNCTFYTKQIHEVFDWSFPCLTKLVLQLYTIQNVEFLNYLPQLKWLTLMIMYDQTYAAELSNAAVESICRCQRLEVFQYAVINEVTSACSINLTQVSNSLSRLQRLDVNNLLISISGNTLIFPSLKMLKFSEVEFSNQDATLQLSCPCLDTLSVSARDLARIHVAHQCVLRKLKVQVNDLPLDTVFNTFLLPFLQRFDKVTALTVHKVSNNDGNAGEFFPSSIQLGIETLSFKNVVIHKNCIQQFLKWKTLKELIISNCLIKTGEQPKPVQFEQWHRNSEGLWDLLVNKYNLED